MALILGKMFVQVDYTTLDFELNCLTGVSGTFLISSQPYEAGTADAAGRCGAVGWKRELSEQQPRSDSEQPVGLSRAARSQSDSPLRGLPVLPLHSAVSDLTVLLERLPRTQGEIYSYPAVRTIVTREQQLTYLRKWGIKKTYKPKIEL
ncbi:hypothetical protein J6590_001444 [Homalodisca vitripennis]|nr:hypothetical protein J6590_001444 [Homalodisca vitripennis]